MQDFLALNYWFNLRPEALTSFVLKYFVAAIALFFIMTLVIAIVKARSKNLYYKIWKDFYGLFLTNTIIGVLLLFFTFETVPFLAARFWFLLWAISDLVWLFFISRQLIKIPKIKKEIE